MIGDLSFWELHQGPWRLRQTSLYISWSTGSFLWTSRSFFDPNDTALISSLKPVWLSGRKNLKSTMFHPESNRQAKCPNKEIFGRLGHYASEPQRIWDRLWSMRVMPRALFDEFNSFDQCLSRHPLGLTTSKYLTVLTAYPTENQSLHALRARPLHQVTNMPQNLNTRTESLHQRYRDIS